MTGFTFPKPGERTNTSAIPVPPHTLIALLAAAMAWEIDTDAAHPSLVPPQLKDATLSALGRLDTEEAHLASQIAKRLLQDRTEAEQG